MSLRTLPILFLNLGGEMLYILDQRLRAQSIPDEKARKGKIFSRADCQLLMASSSSFELFNFNKRIHAIISRSQRTLDCATWIKALQFHFSEQCGVAVVSKTSISDFICIGDNIFISRLDLNSDKLDLCRILIFTCSYVSDPGCLYWIFQNILCTCFNLVLMCFGRQA